MTWDEDVDFLIIGSGAAGLSAAIVAAENKARIKVIEKSAFIGGTSATSGGGVWIPCSSTAAAMGQQDTESDAFNYLRGLVGEGVSDERIRAFVRGAPTMQNWLARHTELRFNSVPYPDYHPEVNGAAITGWRTHFPDAFDGRRLGKTVNRIREASPAASFLGIVNWTLEETHFLLHRPKGWKRVFAKLLWRYISDIPQRLHSRRDRFLTLGNAIIGCLVFALRERGVEVQCNSRLIELIREDGAVVGARIDIDGRPQLIKSRAILLASGGFERSATLRQRFLPAPGQNPEMSGSQESNVGDAITLAESVNAAMTYQEVIEAVAPIFPDCQGVYLHLWQHLDYEQAEYMEVAAAASISEELILTTGQRLNKTDFPFVYETRFDRLVVVEDVDADDRGQLNPPRRRAGKCRPSCACISVRSGACAPGPKPL